MTDGELIAALAKADTPTDLLMAVASRLARRGPTELVPTDDEKDLFERLWAFRQQFTRRPGDPKKPALLKFCRQMREKPATFDEITFGIRSEYGVKKDKPEHYAQMETFINQRRWESYDYAGYQRARAQREAIASAPNVTSIRKPSIDADARRQHAESLRAKFPILAVGE